MRKELTTNQWNRIKSFFPDKTGERGRPPKNHRMMINAILWILRTGAPWRDLPHRYGSWKSVYTRFSRWSKSGLWCEIFAHISKNSNYEYNMIDSTVVKVHQHGSGAKGGHFLQAIGRSVGGLTTKIHLLADGNGLPLRIDFTEGKTHDSGPAIGLLNNLIAKCLLADKAYDFYKIVELIENQGIECVIPSRKTNLIQRNYDKNKYKQRNIIERFFSKIKHFRSIATRYVKLLINYKSMVLFGFIMVWIRFKDII